MPRTAGVHPCVTRANLYQPLLCYHGQLCCYAVQHAYCSSHILVPVPKDAQDRDVLVLGWAARRRQLYPSLPVSLTISGGPTEPPAVAVVTWTTYAPE